MAIKLHARFAVHPGAWLRSKTIDPHGLFATDAAAKPHVTRQAMSNFARRAGLSAEMAIRFEKACGLSADTLMRMQAAHDLAASGRGRGRLPWSGWGHKYLLYQVSLIFTCKAPPLQGRGWGGAVPQTDRARRGPTPIPSPEGEEGRVGLNETWYYLCGVVSGRQYV